MNPIFDLIVNIKICSIPEKWVKMDEKILRWFPFDGVKQTLRLHVGRKWAQIKFHVACFEWWRHYIRIRKPTLWLNDNGKIIPVQLIESCVQRTKFSNTFGTNNPDQPRGLPRELWISPSKRIQKSNLIDASVTLFLLPPCWVLMNTHSISTSIPVSSNIELVAESTKKLVQFGLFWMNIYWIWPADANKITPLQIDRVIIMP